MIESELKQHFEHLFPPNSQLHLTLHQFLTEWAKKKVLTAFPFPRATKHYCGVTFLAAKIIIPLFSMVQHDLMLQYIQLLLLLTLKFTLQNWHKDTWCWLNCAKEESETKVVWQIYSVCFLRCCRLYVVSSNWTLGLPVLSILSDPAFRLSKSLVTQLSIY